MRPYFPDMIFEALLLKIVIKRANTPWVVLFGILLSVCYMIPMYHIRLDHWDVIEYLINSPCSWVAIHSFLPIMQYLNDYEGRNLWVVHVNLQLLNYPSYFYSCFTYSIIFWMSFGPQFEYINVVTLTIYFVACTTTLRF